MTTAKLPVAGGIGLPAGLVAWLIWGASPAAPNAAVTMTGTALAERAPPANGFEWAWVINGPVSADGGNDIVVDAEGNVFVAGFHGGLDLNWDSVVDIKSSATAYVGARNPLFIKLGRDAADKPMRPRWIRSPGTPADRSQTSIAVDHRGGVYVSGAFMESVSFEGGPTLEGGGNNDAFIARYDGDGSVRWARAFGGPGGGDAIYGLASDRDGNVYAAVTGTDAFPLDERGTKFGSPGRRAAGLVSYDPEGAVRWVRVFGPGAPLAYRVAIAPNGQIYVSGEVEAAADFDGDGSDDLPAPKDRDGFVARFDSEGRLLGAWSLPTPGSAFFGPDGDVYLAGGLGGQVGKRYGPPDFDGDGRPDIELRGGGSAGTWLARYSPEGRRRWVRSYALDQPADLEVRGDIIVLSGSYKGLRDLDEDGRPEKRLDVVAPEKETDLAVLILSARDGRPERVLTAPGPGTDHAAGIALLPDGRSLLVTGDIRQSADFTGDGKFGEGWIVCENLGDLFVAQYRLSEPPPERVAEQPRQRPAEQPRERPAEQPRERPAEEFRERPAERPRESEPVREIRLEVSLAERDGRLRASLVWSGAAGPRVDLLRNGERIATVANDGSYTDVIPRTGIAGPYRYQVCEAGGARCSPIRQHRR